ncbi:hypothetical protein FACS1894211_03750 [Clostridia bacterium]|nr:hypothetical protein FACS1894211_03750 [Clostridia bacterium]
MDCNRKKSELTVSERFVRTLNGQPVDRLPVIEMSMWWDKTIENWQAQGLPWRGKYGSGFTEQMEIMEVFGLDLRGQLWVTPYTGQTPRPAAHGQGMVATADDYIRKLRPTLYPDPEVKFPPEFVRAMKKLQSEGRVVTELILNGPFWEPRQFLGIEKHLFSFYDQSDLYGMMTADMLAWHKKVLEYALNTLKFDFVLFAEDMSYNNGPMIGKNIFDGFIAPYYTALAPLLKAADIFPMLDSDGDIMTPLSWYREVGIRGAEPLEAQAGFDVNAAQTHYPDMAFVGNFDKMIMDKGRRALEREFERLLPAGKRGRFILSVDHQTPPHITLEDYKTFVGLYKRWAVEAAQCR